MRVAQIFGRGEDITSLLQHRDDFKTNFAYNILYFAEKYFAEKTAAKREPHLPYLLRKRCFYEEKIFVLSAVSSLFSCRYNSGRAFSDFCKGKNLGRRCYSVLHRMHTGRHFA